MNLLEKWIWNILCIKNDTTVFFENLNVYEILKN